MYVPAAVVDHPVEAARGRFGFFLRRCFHEGRGKIQMARLLPSLGERGVQGLIELGKHFPMQAAEIALLARKPT